MFTSSCYFIYNTRRDAATEKEVDVLISYMRLERVLFQRFKEKKMGEKKK